MVGAGLVALVEVEPDLAGRVCKEAERGTNHVLHDNEETADGRFYTPRPWHRYVL